MLFCGSSCETHDHPPRIGIPVGRSQTCKGRNHINTVRILHRSRIFFRLGRILNHAQLVPKPLNRCSGHEHTALQRITNFTLRTGSNCGQKPVFRLYRGLSRVHQKETACSIGVFRLARFKTALTEQCSLLVARGSGNGNRPADYGFLCMPVDTAGRFHLGKHAFRDSQPLQNVLIPFLFMNVEQHGAGRIGIIRDKDLSLRQIPDQPGIHRTEEQLALLRHLPGSLYMVQNPFDLRPGKIGVRYQSRTFPDQPVKALLLQPVDLIRSPAALPADGIIDRSSCFSGKADRCFPLVGYSDRRNIRGVRADLAHRLHRHTELGRPDFQRIMLHPSGLRINLGEFLLCGRAYVSRSVKQNAA